MSFTSGSMVCHDESMAYPEKLLTDGESVVYDMRPHWRVLFFPAVVLIVLVFGTVLLLSWVPSDWDWARWVVLAAALVVFLIWVVHPVIKWATSQYVLTNRRVIVRSGIIARQGRDMPLARVNDCHFSYGVIDRIPPVDETQEIRGNAERHRRVADACGDILVEALRSEAAQRLL